MYSRESCGGTAGLKDGMLGACSRILCRESDMCPVGVGPCQGCPLSPILFVLVMDIDMHLRQGWCLDWETTTCPSFILVLLLREGKINCEMDKHIGASKNCRRCRVL